MYVNVTYEITCEMVRGGFRQNLVTHEEFVVEVPVRVRVANWPAAARSRS